MGEEKSLEDVISLMTHARHDKLFGVGALTFQEREGGYLLLYEGEKPAPYVELIKEEVWRGSGQDLNHFLASNPTSASVIRLFESDGEDTVVLDTSARIKS